MPATYPLCRDPSTPARAMLVGRHAESPVVAPVAKEVALGGVKAEGQDDESIDEASTCAPSSVDCSAVQSTPELFPLTCPFDVETLAPLSGKDAKVCIVHHDEMQLHTPPRAKGIYELPRRIIAIENRLKGLDSREGFPKRPWGNAPMQFVRSKPSKTYESLIIGWGSVAAKKRRLSYHTGKALKGSVWDSCLTVQAPIVEDSDLRLVHSKKHMDHVRKLCGAAAARKVSFFPLDREYSQKPTEREDMLDDDVYYSPDSFVAIKRAAGGAVEAVRRLFLTDEATGCSIGRSDIQSSFAIVRPPGHHCCSDPNGFCFFNNSAVAAAHARQVLGLSRVAIVDWDYHHGDGQQKLFYKDPTVLTISLHVAIETTKDGDEDIAFPANKEMDIAWTGSGLGEGYNINIPWPHNKVSASHYFQAFRSVVLPALRGFDPELILVASGFDALMGDTLAGTRLVPSAFYHMTRQLLSLGKPIAVILEGGYSPSRLAQGSLNIMHALLGREPPSDDSDEMSACSSCSACSSSSAASDIDNDDDDADTAACASSSASTASDSNDDRDDAVAGVLDVLRHRLNTLPPWNAMCPPGGVGSRYFFEELSPRAEAGREVARRMSEFIKEKTEQE